MSDTISNTSGDDSIASKLSEDEKRQEALDADRLKLIVGLSPSTGLRTGYNWERCRWCDDTDSSRSVAGSSCDEGELEQRPQDVCRYHPNGLRGASVPMHPQDEFERDHWTGDAWD